MKAKFFGLLKYFNSNQETGQEYNSQMDASNSSKGRIFSFVGQRKQKQLSAIINNAKELDQWRFQDLKESISRDGEWRFQDLKQAMASLDEWRFKDLIRQINHSDEWRFKDLKSFLANEMARDTTFNLEKSIADLNFKGNSNQGAIAVVSVLPPADTGVARFTALTFGKYEGEVDFYTPIQSGFDYLIQKHHRASIGTDNLLLTLDALPYGLAHRNYSAVLFVLANSDHHLPVVKVLRRLREVKIKVDIYIEVHDPVVLNVLTKAIQTEGRELSDVIPAFSEKDLSGVDWNAANKGDHGELASIGVTGLKALLDGIEFRSIIFHSEASRDIVMGDWKNLGFERTLVLFHPVFDDFVPRSHAIRNNDQSVHIGTFGVPSKGKLTDQVVKAFDLVKVSHPGSILTIAGYGATEFAIREEINDRHDINIVDSPSDEALINLMRTVDVAVQLRAKNTGESSGVVPQIISGDTPCICSDIGAFRAFGETVSFVSARTTTEDLADAILLEVQSASAKSSARHKYVFDHSASKFCRDLKAYLTKHRNGFDFASSDLKKQIESPKSDMIHDEGFGSRWDSSDPVPSNWELFEQIAHQFGADEDPYVLKHMRRYRHTLAAMENLGLQPGACGLEIGTSWLFALMMRRGFGMKHVDVTDFLADDPRKEIERTVQINGESEIFSSFNINLEHEILPAADATYDFVLCCEVLEHMDIDPMFMLSEINRVTKTGGSILLSTPNSTSSRNVRKILEGYAPHFFMQYHKDRSPYRHNLEYAPDQVLGLISAAGFGVNSLWTADTFEAPSKMTLRFLEENNFPTTLRGDNIFVHAKKIQPVIDRHPDIIYV